METRNHEGVMLSIPGLYDGPAALRDGVITFRCSTRPRTTVAGTIDGEPVRLRLWRIAGFSSPGNPYVQASIVEEIPTT